jgi:uncharacterized lipoprotein YmbA
MRNYLLCIAATLITGCSSGDQIEKCVQAALKANGPYKSEQEKAGDEHLIRLMCLEAASGKKN